MTHNHLRELRIPLPAFEAAAAYAREDPTRALRLTADSSLLDDQRTEYLIRSVVPAEPAAAGEQPGHAFSLQWAPNPTLAAALLLPKLRESRLAGGLFLPSAGSRRDARGFVSDGDEGFRWLDALNIVGPGMRQIELAAFNGDDNPVAPRSGALGADGPAWISLGRTRITVTGLEWGPCVRLALAHLGARQTILLLEDGAGLQNEPEGQACSAHELDMQLGCTLPDLVIGCDLDPARRVAVSKWCSDHQRVLIELALDDAWLSGGMPSAVVRVMSPGTPAPQDCKANLGDSLFGDLPIPPPLRRLSDNPRRAAALIALRHHAARAAAGAAIDLLAGQLPPAQRIQLE